MSTIGIFDADMYKYIHVPFNLECMKLAAYYKKKRDIVNMAMKFTPDMYTKFIYRKDYSDNEYPENIHLIQNISYGGYAFSNKYSPFDETIESYQPDPTIYLPYFDSFATSKRYAEAYEIMGRAQHIRLSLDSETVWPQFHKQLTDISQSHMLFLHDNNIAEIKDSFEAIQDISQYMSKTVNSKLIGMKFPIRISNEKDLFKWAQLEPSKDYFLMQFDGILSDETFFNFIWIDVTRGFFRQFEYNVTGSNFDEEKFISQDLIKLYRQMAFARMSRRKVILKYNASLFKEPMWCRVIDLLNIYTSSLASIKRDWYYSKILDTDSLYSFVKQLQENPVIKTYPVNKQQAREIFQFVRDHNYELFKQFYEGHKVKIRGGEFCNVKS